jgi:hypothetical protein
MQEPGHQPPDRAGELSYRELVNAPYDESLHYEAMNDRDCTAENPGHYQRSVVQIHTRDSTVRAHGKSVVLMRDAQFFETSVRKGRPVLHSRPRTQLVVQSSA